jgi:NAD(P)-dependent dehydrogenase (short-subunit alcohol dehydrogenase family)
MEPRGLAAIVTGGGSGLGAATAERLAADGARVALIDMNAAAVNAVARRVGGIAIAGDVADAAGMEKALAEARAAHGPVRILVNCAGVAVARRTVGRDGPMPLDEFERVIRVNLIGTFNMMRLAGAQMSGLEPLADGERGVIVSTASIAAFEGQVGQAAYSASKGGVAALTLPVARELAAFGVRVLAIAPGLFDTPMLQALPEPARQSLSGTVPFPQRLGNPAEFAALVAHMIANRFLNGEVVRLDGAIRLAPR